MDHTKQKVGRPDKMQQKAQQSNLTGIGSWVGDTNPKPIKNQSKGGKKGDKKKSGGMMDIWLREGKRDGPWSSLA